MPRGPVHLPPKHGRWGAAGTPTSLSSCRFLSSPTAIPSIPSAAYHPPLPLAVPTRKPWGWSSAAPVQPLLPVPAGLGGHQLPGTWQGLGTPLLCRACLFVTTTPVFVGFKS